MRLIVLSFLALSIAGSHDALAGWPPGGVPIAPITLSEGQEGHQFRPHVLVSDVGAFVYWQDARWLDSWDLYGQLVTSNGLIAPAWPDTGFMIARAPNNQIPAPGYTLADGSFLVTFADYRDHVIGGTGQDPYVTRVRTDATIDPGWPRHGFQAVSRLGSQRPAVVARVAPDTLLILFRSDFDEDVMAQRVAISPSGPSAVWSMDALLVASGPRSATFVAVAPDGSGGCFISFDDWTPTAGSDPGDSDVHVTRIGRDGAPHPGWTLAGRPVAVAPGYQETSTICEDGAGGVYVAWSDSRTGGVLPFPDYLWQLDIRLAHLDAEGSPRPGWPTDGLVISGRPGWQYVPQLLPDGTGGVWVLWDDYSGGVSLTHVQADGTFAPGWQQDGLRVSTLDTYQNEPKMVPDGAGGFYVRIIDESNGDLYLQHVLGSGVRDPLWPPQGHLVTDRAGNGSEDCDIAADGMGGCYVVFQRPLGGTGPLNLHIARYSPDGPVPVKLAEATAESEPDRVRLTWHGVEGAASELTVQRRPEGIESWSSLGSPTARGRDVVQYEDTQVEPGASYAYRLTRGVEILSEEIVVTVPAAAVFALAGAQPNPALARELRVAFTLAGGGRAELEVLDLAGRREYTRRLDGLTPGRHALSLADAGLAPGIHWLRLREGPHVALARMVVVR